MPDIVQSDKAPSARIAAQLLSAACPPVRRRPTPKRKKKPKLSKRKRRKQRQREAIERKRKRLVGLSYYEYLETRDWARLRKKALKRAGYKCEICHETTGARAWQVHHMQYPPHGKWWLDTLRNLQALCGDCHQVTHELKAPDVPWGWRYT